MNFKYSKFTTSIELLSHRSPLRTITTAKTITNCIAKVPVITYSRFTALRVLYAFPNKDFHRFTFVIVDIMKVFCSLQHSNKLFFTHFINVEHILKHFKTKSTNALYGHSTP